MTICKWLILKQNQEVTMDISNYQNYHETTKFGSFHYTDQSLTKLPNL